LSIEKNSFNDDIIHYQKNKYWNIKTKNNIYYCIACNELVVPISVTASTQYNYRSTKSSDWLEKILRKKPLLFWSCKKAINAISHLEAK